MELLAMTFSVIFLVLLFVAYRCSGGFFTVAFLTMSYIGFLYLGSLHLYVTKGHLTFVFVFFMGVFCLLGMFIASKLWKFKSSKIYTWYLKIYDPLNSSILKFSLVIMFLISLAISLYRLKRFGIPLIERAWYTTGLRSTSGWYNRILLNLGPEGMLILALLFYSMYKSHNKKIFAFMWILSFLLHLTFKVLQGGKAVAIFPFLLMFMAVFYIHRKFSKKILIMGSVVALCLALCIGFFWIGKLSLYQILRLYYERATNIAALHLDYLLYEWAPNHPYWFGKTLLLEVKRIAAHITAIPKEPLFNELIDNLRLGRPVNTITGVSPELSLFGVGYANFGILGAIFSATILGFVTQLINVYLLSQREMSLFSFTAWMYFLVMLLSGMRSGNILICFETYLVQIILVLGLTLIGYFYLALPFMPVLKRRKAPL